MTVTAVQVQGICAPGFEPVREAFAENLSRRGEIGASVAVVTRGEPVVNLWAGWAGPGRDRPWQKDTLTNVWGVSKALTALCAHVLIDRGELNPDDPVSRYWPQFAAAGKAGITVRWVLSHRAGLPGFAEPLSVPGLADWGRLTALLAGQRPLWEPGTAAGYHALTFGYLAGELVRRVTGQSPGRFLATEVAGPLGADVHIGLPVAALGRCSDLQERRLPPDERDVRRRSFAAAHPAVAAALTNPPLRGAEANDPAWRTAEIPAVNAHATALGLATIFGSLVDGSGKVLRAETLRTVTAGQGRCLDLVLRYPVDYALGFVVSGPEGHYGPNRAAFGHDGFGGAAAGADPEQGLAFAYVTNRLGNTMTGDPRKQALIGALYRCLGSGPAPAFTF